MTLGQIFLILIDVWQDYVLLNINKKISLNQVFTIEDPLIDMNNNNLTAMTIHNIKQINPSADTRKNYDKNCGTMDEYFYESTKKNDCICQNSTNCCGNLKYNHCYCMNCTSQSTTVYTENSTNNVAYEEKLATFSTRDIGLSIKDAIDATFFSIYKKYKTSSYRDNSDDFCVSNV